MLAVGIPHRPTEHGKCGLCSLLSLINYPAELSWENVTGLLSSVNLFDIMRRHMCNCLMWQGEGGRYVVPL